MKKGTLVNEIDGVVEFIEGKNLGFVLGKAVEYIAKTPQNKTEEIDNLEKAVWYIKRRIQELKNGKEEKIEKEDLNKESNGINFNIFDNKVMTTNSDLNQKKKDCPVLQNKEVLYDKVKESKQVADKVDHVSEYDAIWNKVYDVMKMVDPSYTREEFDKDLEEAEEEINRVMRSASLKKDLKL